MQTKFLDTIAVYCTFFCEEETSKFYFLNLEFKCQEFVPLFNSKYRVLKGYIVKMQETPNKIQRQSYF